MGIESLEMRRVGTQSDIEVVPQSVVTFNIVNNTNIPIGNGRLVDVAPNVHMLHNFFASQSPPNPRFNSLPVWLAFSDKDKLVGKIPFRSAFFDVAGDEYVHLNTPQILGSVKGSTDEDEGIKLSTGLAYEFAMQCAVLKMYCDQEKHENIDFGKRLNSRALGWFGGSFSAQALLVFCKAIRSERKLSRREFMVASLAGVVAGNAVYDTSFDPINLARSRLRRTNYSEILDLAEAFPVHFH